MGRLSGWKALMPAVLTCLLVLLFMGSAPAWGDSHKPVVHWPHFEWPPYYIIDGETVSGVGFEIQELLRANLPGYDHRIINSPPQRSLQQAKTGETYCFTGALRTPDRERYLTYSIPCRLTEPQMLVIRKADSKRFAPFMSNGTLSLARILAKQTLSLGLTRGFRYPKGVEAILADYKLSSNVELVHRENSMDVRLSLLMANRIDCFLALPANLIYLAKQRHLLNRIEIYPLLESNEYAVGYIACTSNPVGEELIGKINKILMREVPRKEYLEQFTRWVVPSLVPGFTERYRKLVINRETAPEILDKVAPAQVSPSESGPKAN